jgi:hypothetical protein
VADDDDMRDWAADCDGEGQEQVVRDGGDSGVVMMAAAAEDSGGGWQWPRRTTTAADNSGMHFGRGGLQRGRTRAGGKRWRRHRVAMTAATVEDGSGG